MTPRGRWRHRRAGVFGRFAGVTRIPLRRVPAWIFAATWAEPPRSLHRTGFSVRRLFERPTFIVQRAFDPAQPAASASPGLTGAVRLLLFPLICIRQIVRSKPISSSRIHGSIDTQTTLASSPASSQVTPAVLLCGLWCAGATRTC